MINTLSFLQLLGFYLSQESILDMMMVILVTNVLFLVLFNNVFDDAFISL